ncbi:MAG TPA: T9SS type A sorting domain-containing protein [Patescibacteria group bacterium]|nr:T9SS type A sorting domain-containing protein [Patescibacteria group bacterium]
MKKLLFTLLAIACIQTSNAQTLPPKQAYPFTVKQIHSGHSLTDPLFYPHWPGQYVNLMTGVRGVWAGDAIGKSTMPGSAMKARWETPPGYGAPDARHGIKNWELLCITERVPLLYPGGNSQQWYLDGIQEQRQHLSLFVNNAWNSGNNGAGAPTLLWTTWTNINNSDGPWRQMLETMGAEWESMQDYANANRPSGAPPVYLIPGHKMMARLYDDIQAGIVPDITNISQFFSDNIHTNELGAYAIAMIHYACIYNKNPTGLPNNLLPNAPIGTPIPSKALATYLQTMIWDVVTKYDRTGIASSSTAVATDVENEATWNVFPNPASDFLFIDGVNVTNGDRTYIFNNLGEVVYSGNENRIDIGHLVPGPYFLKAGSRNATFIKK